MAAYPGRRQPAVVLAGLVSLPFRPEGQTMTFLIDGRGGILWSEKPDAAYEEALRGSTLVADFMRRPSVFVSEHWQQIGERKQRMIAQVSPIGDVGWGLVVQQPRSEAFGAARQVVNSTLISALLMLVLALVFAVGASQLFSRPIQRLATTSAEIAAGNFGGRVSESGFSRELTNLASNFNVMSSHVEESVARLRRAAEENHLLFVGSIRALLAAIEAKEPYTRGHSERVAAYSRAIARHLGLEPELEEQIWVSGLVHDVGKIGIEDRILKKGNALTEEEFEAIKRHPIIGEEILAPIEQLSYSLPAIRWHHEKWNGRGYPDGLRREAIPLPARIVSVADSFDAMTTQRVYQQPLSPTEAVAWIRQQSSVSFDAKVVEAFMKAYLAQEIKPPEASEMRPRPGPAAGGGGGRERLHVAEVTGNELRGLGPCTGRLLAAIRILSPYVASYRCHLTWPLTGIQTLACSMNVGFARRNERSWPRPQPVAAAAPGAGEDAQPDRRAHHRGGRGPRRRRPRRCWSRSKRPSSPPTSGSRPRSS